ncbi:MAG: energy transducer TonB [Holophagaceae bacterium]|nr:energy transducer TonB [Holophagaceae bacterium]
MSDLTLPPPAWEGSGFQPAGRARWLWIPLYAIAVLLLLAWKIEALSLPPRPPVIRVALAMEPPEYRPPIGPRPGPPGGSHRQGNVMIDVRLLSVPALEVVTAPPQRVLPVVDTELRALEPPMVLDRSLPVGAHGNGVPRGDGHGFGRGHGDGVGNGTGMGGQGLLKLVKSVMPDYDRAAELAPIDGQSVKVRLRVGADGVPQEATLVSGHGRRESFPAILKAALRWRFMVPAGFADQAPFEVVVDFTYHKAAVRSGRAAQMAEVTELKPVELR